MKIDEPKWSRISDQKNQDAVDNPQVGDYWHERFCPYFIVVKVKDDDITVLSFVGGPESYNRKDEINAKIKNGDNTWSADCSKHMIVNREWIKKLVSYGSIPGFVADVVRYGESSKMVIEWKEFHRARLEQELKEFM